MKKFKKVIAGVCALSICVSAMPISGTAVYANELTIVSENGSSEKTVTDSSAGSVDAGEVIDVLTEETTEPATEEAAENSCGDNAYYSLADGVLTISGTGAVNERAFYKNSSIKSVVIEEGITSIGIAAFYGCENLTSITLPSTLTSIDTDAFNYTEISEVTMPDAECVLGENAFGSSLRRINGYLGSSAEEYCTTNEVVFKDIETDILYCGINTTAILQDGVLTVSGTGNIYDLAFYGHTEITSVIIEDGIVEIGARAFSECTNLTSVALPETIINLQNFAFYNSGITSVVIPASIGVIGVSVFAYCENLSSVTLSEGLTTLGDSMFENCASLTSVSLPESVTLIDSYALYGTGITELTVTNPECTLEYYSLPSNVKIIANAGSAAQTFANDYGYIFVDLETGISSCGENATFTLEDGVLTISGTGAIYDNVFDSNDSITSVVIESGITEIGRYTFSNCESIKSVTLPDTITNIGNNCFEGCSALTEIEFPASLTSLGDYAFSTCTSLTSVTLPASITYMGSYVFEYCTGLTSAVFEEGLTTTGSYTFYNCDVFESVTLPESLLTIDAGAFSGTALTSLTIPQNVTTIGYNAFYYIYFDEITIPASVTSLATNSLYHADVVIIENPECEISDYAFDDTILKGYVGSTAQAYANSYNCRFIDIETGNTYCGENATYTIVDGVLTISGTGSVNGSANFRNLNVKSVIIEEGITEIAQNAFYYCYDIESVTLPESLTKIDVYAFQRCYALTEIVIPANVSYIGACAFMNCGLKEVTILNTECEIGAVEVSAFGGAVIVGYAGSTAETYAMNNDCGFKNIETGETTCGENAKYTIVDGVLTVTGTGAVSSSAFVGDDSVTSIVFEEGITDLDSYYYNRDFTNLESISIPSTVTNISIEAFYFTDNSVAVNISEDNALYSYANGMLLSKDKTELYACFIDSGAVIVPETVEIICESAFAYKDITSVDIPESVTEIKEEAFYYCRYLSEVIIRNTECVIFDSYNTIYSESGLIIIGYTGSTAETYASIYSKTFCDIETGSVVKTGSCGDNATYTLMNGVLTISGTGVVNDSSFEYDDTITSVIIGEGITEIGYDAFYYCENLSSVSFPSTLTTISNYAFYGCGFEDILLPENVSYVGSGAFAYGELLETITITNPACEFADTNYIFPSGSLIIAEKDSTAFTYAMNYGINFMDIESGIMYCGNDATYTLENGILTVSGTGTINNSAFYENESITSVIIEEGITSIGDNAFYSCYNLNEVSFPESLVSIGEGAFQYCDINGNIVIPVNVTEIGEYAFYAYYYDSTLTIMNPECVIYDSSYTIDASMYLIEGYAGSTAEDYAIKYGRRFKDIETGKVVERGSCGDNANYILKDGTLTITGTGAIGRYSFSHRSGINEVIIEEGITEIGEYAFYYCDNMKTVSIPSTVTNISVDAFDNCYNITSFDIAETNTSYSYANGSLMSADKTKLISCIIYDKNNPIPETVTEIGPFAFDSCDYIVNITIPEQVTSIGEFAFGNCSNLERITILNKECVIADSKGTICNSYVRESEWMYDEETGKEYVEYYYHSETYDGLICGYSGSTAYDYAFNYGKLFMDFETGVITQMGKCGENLVYEIKNGILIISGTGAMYDTPDFSGNDNITDVIVEEGVTTLGSYAFSNSDSLRAISLPSTLTEIGERAFYNSYNLSSIIIPDNVTKIGDYAFAYCQELNGLSLPSKLETIGDSAFYYCTDLNEIIIPESVISIADDAFYNCRNVETIKINSKDCEIYNSSTVFPKNSAICGYNVSTAHDYAYNYGRKFVDIETGAQNYEGKCGENLTFTIVDGVLTISGSGKMYDYPSFNENEEIREVIIGDEVTSIGVRAFYDCTNISSITIPTGITSIGHEAFYGCNSLVEINVSENNTSYSSVDGVLFDKSGKTLISYPYGLYTSNYNVPESVELIKEDAFSGYDVAMVTITNTECDIEAFAFNSETIICGYAGSTAELYAYDYSCYFNDIETGITTRCGRCGDNLVYELDMAGTLTISGTGAIYSYHFAYNNDIKNVIIESGVTEISYSAFEDCYNIVSVSIPDTVTYIGESAFSYCYALESIVIPPSVKRIGYSTFEYCYNLKEVTLSEGLEEIGNEVFNSCEELTSITIPASVTLIDDDAFDNSYLESINVAEGNTVYSSVDGVLYNKAITDLINYPSNKNDTEYTLQETVTNISNGVLRNSNLTKLTITNPECVIEDNVNTISSDIIIYGYENSTAQKYAYDYGKKFCIIDTDKIIQQGVCGDNLTYDITDGVLTISGTGTMYDSPQFSSNDEITKVVIEEGVVSIGAYAFYSCDSITEVSIASTVESIHDYAFNDCDELVSIDIPAEVSFIGSQVFTDGYQLSSINVDADNATYTSVDGVLFDKAVNELISYPMGKTDTSYNVPETVTKISDYAFSDNSYLESIVVPDTVTYFGHYSFYNCYNLTTINFPKSLETIGNSAFNECNSLSCDIIIPDSVTTIGNGAFGYCDLITNVVLPESVSLVDYYAFSGCYNLEKITINNPDCIIYEGESTIYRNAVICGYADSTAYNYAYKYGRKFMNIETEEVTQKGKCGVNLVYEIKDNVLTISGTGEMYDDPMFSDNNDITSVIISDGVTSIGNNAFYSYDNLESVSIADTVVKIGEGAFECCYQLTEINLPESIIRIGDYAFYECDSLKNVTLPSSLKGLSYSMFNDCDSLETIVIPEGITEISRNAFARCLSLKSVTLPESLTSIENSAFISCCSLESITIPESVTYIGSSAFVNCSSLISVDIPANVSHIVGNVFSGSEALTSINVDAENKDYASVDGVLYNKSITILIAYPSGKADKTYTTPDTVEIIGGGAFSPNNNLTEIILGESVDEIEESAIRYSENLENVTVKNPACDFIYTAVDTPMITGYEGSTTEIYAFNHNIVFKNIETGEEILKGMCGSTSEYEIKDGVLTISGSGDVTRNFSSDEVTKLVIGENITGFEDYSFANLENLETVEISDANEHFTCVDGIVYSADMTELLLYPSGLKATELIIPDSVINVAYIYSPNLEKITFGANVDFGEIGYNDEIYYECDIYGENIREYVVSEQNKNIKVVDNVLYDYDLTTIISVPLNITGAVEIPDTVGNVYQWFSGCTNITSIKLPSNMTYIPESAFAGCTSLTKIELPDTLEEIYYAVFEGSGLKEIVIPESVEYIYAWAFANCADLEKITILNPDIVFGGFGYVPEEGEEYEDTSFTIINNFVQLGTYDEETGEFVEDIKYNFDGVIYGVSGSTAQKYAEKWGYTFKDYNATTSVGDVNEDGVINALDASVVLGAYAAVQTGGSSGLTAGQLEAADVNDDGKVDAIDASSILSYYAYMATGGTGTIEDFLNNK